MLEEAFRRILLAALRRAERLSEETHEQLLAWAHSGFSVHAEQRVAVGDGAGMERLARYVTRPALAQGAVTLREDGKAVVKTPPDPGTGATELVLDPLDLVHAVVTQIPEARKHLVRYFGAYSSRFRARVGRGRRPGTQAPEGEGKVPGEGGGPGAGEQSEAEERTLPAEPGSPEARRRSAWARVLRKVFEVDPLLCPRCGAAMRAIAWITDPAVIDRILAHRQREGLDSPFDARAPPAA